MGRWQYSITLNAPPETVFDCLLDVPAYADCMEGIERVEVLTDGPVGVGTRYRETRRMMGKEHSEEMTFTAIGPRRGFTIECFSCGTAMTFVHRVLSEGDGTRVEIDMISEPQTLAAKLMSPLGALMKGSMRKMIDKDFADIERYLGGVDPAPTVG